MKQILFFLVIIVSLNSNAGELSRSKQWCDNHKGIQKALHDGTIPDCILDKYVVEVEHLNESPKVFEAIGQALHYSTVSKKIPIIVYYFDEPVHKKYLERIKNIIDSKSLEVHLCDLNNDCPILETQNAENNLANNDLELKNATSPSLGTSVSETKSSCERYCKEGKACGNSCINKSFSCSKPKGTACDIISDGSEIINTQSSLPASIILQNKEQAEY